MCKYCEEIYIYKNADIALKRYNYRIEYKDGKFNTIADDDVYELQNITHCPWCGRKLELPDDEAESSAEDEIARLDRRINHTNALLDRLAENLERWVNRDHYNIDMKAKVLYDMKDIRGKLLDESC